MKYYSQQDFDQNKKDKQRALTVTLLVALPFLVLAVIAFIVRIEPLCIAGCIAFGCLLVLLFDLKVMPSIRYGGYMREAHSGMSRRTLGTLVRVSDDLSYVDGVDLREVTINIYEDLCEEGERRFWLDARKEMPLEWMNQDVVLTSHEGCILEAELYQTPEQREVQA